MPFSRSLLPLSLFGLVAALGADSAEAASGARRIQNASLAGPTPRAGALSRDAAGVPRLLLAPAAGALPAPLGSSFEDAARFHLRALGPTYGASPAAIDGARALFTHDVGRGGVIVALRQRVGDVEVFASDVKVLLDRSMRLVAVSGAPHPAARAELARPFGLSREAAVAGALGELYGPRIDASKIAAAPGAPRAGFAEFTIAASAGPTSVTMRAPARVKQVYFPLGQALVPAYFVELQTYLGARPDLDAEQVVIAADDGRVLYRRSMIAYDAFTYTVWADGDGDHRPADGPLVDYTPHPTEDPNDPGPGEFVKAKVITIEGFNTNPEGEADPWLPADATETLGNNIDAYVDHLNPSGLQPDVEFRATVNGDKTFDYLYNGSAQPLASTEQSMAAIVQLFFDNNWLHDYWYDSGFDEAAGNAQEDNYGRGGEGGDRLQAQAQDGALEGSRNNANMMTPSDGASPVMQMYLWSPIDDTATLTVSPPDTEYTVSKGQFGPGTFDVSAPLALLDDGGGVSPTDGCEPPINDLAGKIALIDRGDCTFETKVNHAEEAGAVGVVIANNVDGGPPGLGNDNQMMDPTIPTVAVTIGDGAALKAGLKEDALTAHMTGETGIARDGTIDNMIVAHEWGHYIHHRLVECGSSQCGAQSEGWGDFLSLHTMLREGDDLDGTFASTTYASFDPAGYFGIRRAPYSVDMSRNPFTFRNIADGEPLPVGAPLNGGGQNSEVHNAGEVWATMMWESYVALHKANAGKKSFDEIRRSMADYVVAGMMMAPQAPSYTDQRDAILLAISTFDEEDFMTVAQAFARRGAGTCAISPPTESVDFVGVVEDFELRANAGIVDGSADDSVQSCDNDGVIDEGEGGKIAVEIYNNGVLDLPAGALVEVSASSSNVVFPGGATVELGALPRLSKTDVSFAVATVAGLTEWEPVTFTVKVVSDDGCEGSSELKIREVIHGDIVPASSAYDDVEVPDSPWEIVGSAGALVWEREATGAGYAWRGRDIGKSSDTSLVSPPLEVLAEQPLVISFDHAYKFEFSDNIFWDGGVIELSTDDGMTWEDVALHVDPGYGGVIVSDANVLNGQSAYVDENPSYPAADAVSLDFGSKFAGQTVRLRFRIGTDGAMGAAGWLIDNIAVSGIANTPFPTWTPDNCGMGGTGGDSMGGETDGMATGGGETDSATGTAGQGGGDDGGCGCSTEGGGQGQGAAALGLWLLAAGLGRRRRRG